MRSTRNIVLEHLSQTGRRPIRLTQKMDLTRKAQPKDSIQVMWVRNLLPTGLLITLAPEQFGAAALKLLGSLLKLLGKCVHLFDCPGRKVCLDIGLPLFDQGKLLLQ